MGVYNVFMVVPVGLLEMAFTLLKRVWRIKGMSEDNS